MRLLNCLINGHDHAHLCIYYDHYDRDYVMHANGRAVRVNDYVSDRGNGRESILLITSAIFSL